MRAMISASAVVVVALALFLSGCSDSNDPTGPSGPTLNYQGSWSGTTNQSHPISFAVNSDNTVTTLTVRVSVPACGLSFTTTYTSSTPIVNGAFSYGELSGTFASATSVSGTANISTNIPGCSTSTSFTWNASKK